MKRILAVLMLTQLLNFSTFAQEISVKNDIKSFRCKIDVDADYPSYTELKYEIDDLGKIKPVQYVFLDGLMNSESFTVDIGDVLWDKRGIMSISATLSDSSKVNMNTIVNLNTKEGQIILKSRPDLKPSDKKYKNFLMKYPLINCNATFVQ